MPFTNVDCLGKNIISGILLDDSENTECVLQSLVLFKLDVPGATLMTDGGSAYPGVAAQAEMLHVLCSHHFQQDVFSSAGGMGSQSDIFKRDAMSLIYTSFCSEDYFEQHATSCLD